MSTSSQPYPESSESAQDEPKRQTLLQKLRPCARGQESWERKVD